jgi:signal transduction histidine kinase/PAS domain-containing protein
MDSSIRTTLWGAYAALIVLIITGLAVTVGILQSANRQDYQVIEGSAPLLKAVNSMDDDTNVIISAAQGYSLTQQSAFTAQYDDAVRNFEKSASAAVRLATDPRDTQLVFAMRKHFIEMKQLTDHELELVRDGKLANANEVMVEAARIRRSTPDYDGLMGEEHEQRNRVELQRITGMRDAMTMLALLIGVAIILIAAYLVSRVQQSLAASIARQVRRTEAMIAGMSDGVVLVDGEGRTVFLNAAAQTLLGRNDIGVPIFKHAEVYRLRDAAGKPIDAKELPAARALSTGKAVREMTAIIDRDDREIAISMNAKPLYDDGKLTGVVVTFRDVTERQRLEEELQLQAERAQILADAGAFFASNIDPVWVTQAISERIAEVVGDWAAVILKSAGTNEMRVASISHRDLASLGLAWAYIYRQTLTVGEGIIGQVVATGFPSLTTNINSAMSGMSAATDTTSYHTPTMQLSSLLILPLRTRRETIGALVIAANDPDRVMTEDKLPLAEALAERASLAIDNAMLYTEQVEARRKVEDLSRLKDEFLSIASHELRTPVTSIKGYTQLAKTLIHENDLRTSEEYLDIALEQIDRMSRLILELLDVSRIETGRLEIRREPIEWTAFVHEVVHHHHTAVSDRRLALNVPVNGKRVLGDRDRLEQVLGNLMENAVKYSPDGSEIVVTVEDKGDHLVTSVRDRGIGIPADELSQVFERFHRGRQVSSTNYGGLGLGLYISKQIIERHGGTIWVESAEGVGTAFYFSLPVASVGAPQPAEELVGRS